MKNKKREKSVCPRCHHPGFKLLPWDESRPAKPVFSCDKCQNTWSSGRDGREYIKGVMNPEIAEATLRSYENWRSK